MAFGSINYLEYSYIVAAKNIRSWHLKYYWLPIQTTHSNISISETVLIFLHLSADLWPVVGPLVSEPELEKGMWAEIKLHSACDFLLAVQKNICYRTGFAFHVSSAQERDKLSMDYKLVNVLFTIITNGFWEITMPKCDMLTSPISAKCTMVFIAKSLPCIYIYNIIYEYLYTDTNM